MKLGEGLATIALKSISMILAQSSENLQTKNNFEVDYYMEYLA